MPKSKRLYFKDPDALRFLAFVPVFLYCILYLTRTELEGFHHELTVIVGLTKTASIDFFFFLTAFLLTSHGLREYKYHENFDLRNFILRKIVRFGPVLTIALIFAFIVHPWILRILKLNDIPFPTLFNYLTMQPHYLDQFSKEQYIYLAIIWSIFSFFAFTIVWGFVLKYFKNLLIQISIGLMVVGLGIRILYHYLEINFEFNALAFGIAIGLGSMTAYLVRNDSVIIDKIKNLPKKITYVIYLAGLIFILSSYVFTSNFLVSSFIPFISCLYFGFLIINQTFGKNIPVKFRDNKLLVQLGKLSYGLLIYQSIINVLIVIGIDSLDFEIDSAMVKGLFTVVGFGFSWVIADLSYNFIEKPIQRIVREFKKN